MFVAVRDIRFAKGRFTLMGAVVALLTGLVLFLYGLTGGLACDSTSALTGLPVRAVVFGGPSVSFGDSAITADQQAAWQRAAGARPLGMSMAHFAATSASVVGVDPALQPPPVSGRAPGPDEVAVGAGLARQQGLRPGSPVSVGPLRLTVSGITPDRSWGHAPTVWTDEPTWQRIAGGAEPVAMTVAGPADPASVDTATLNTAALDKAQHTKTVGLNAARAGIDGYSAEQGSLTLIQGFLFVISALVAGAFFTVWTVQRKADIAVLKAIGASSAHLVRDALGQALILLLTGGAAGAVASSVGGVVLRGSGTPFVLNTATVAVPLAAMVGLGLAGAALAVRRIVTVDPLTALGAAR